MSNFICKILGVELYSNFKVPEFEHKHERGDLAWFYACSLMASGLPRTSTNRKSSKHMPILQQTRCRASKRDAGPNQRDSF